MLVVEHAGDPLGDSLKRPIACGVSKQIVDFLEPVEVEAQNGKPPPGAQCDCNFLIEFLIEAAAIGQPRECVMVSKKQNMLFRLLACTKIANRDGAVRLAAQIDDPLDELNRHFRAVAMMQDALDRLVLAIEQLETQVRVGKVLFELRADDSIGTGVTAERDEIIIDCDDGVAVANQETFDGGIGEAAHPVSFQARRRRSRISMRDAAERKHNDDKARERHRDGEKCPPAMPMRKLELSDRG